MVGGQGRSQGGPPWHWGTMVVTLKNPHNFDCLNEQRKKCMPFDGFNDEMSITVRASGAETVPDPKSDRKR